MKANTHHPSRYRERTTAIKFVIAIMVALFGQTAIAMDHMISPQTRTFDCSAVNPGDTVTLPSGSRDPLKIAGCVGSAAAPIVIRNDRLGTSRTVIRRASGDGGGFLFECDDCVHVRIDGSGKWTGAPAGTTYGILVTLTGGEGPSVFLKLSGVSRFVTIKNVEVDGTWPRLATKGIGISAKDSAIKASAYPGAWIEGLVFENNFVHDIHAEGFYVGDEWYVGSIPLRNIEIRNNRIENAGWDGIQVKSAIAGRNQIFGNEIRGAGLRRDAESAGQTFGISLLESNGRIFGNWIERSGDSAIQHFIKLLPQSYGDQYSEIFNNVIIDSGLVQHLSGHGITVGNQSGYARPKTKIYYNTIVRAKEDGISVGSRTASGLVSENIVVDAVGTPISAPSVVTVRNNRIGRMADLQFVNSAGLDFRLKASSPARNAGGAEFPPDDFDGNGRPQDGASDQGAFEFVVEGDTKPTPPTGLVVQ